MRENILEVELTPEPKKKIKPKEPKSYAFIPALETFLTIDLPGEKLRALVKKVLDKNKIILQLTSVPLAKSHNYQKDDFVACKRVQGIFGEMWEVIESRPSLKDFVEQVHDKGIDAGATRKKRKK